MAIDYVGKKCIMTNEGQWSAQTAYEPLCFVTDTNGNSYCSKIDVPAGTPLENTTYWIPQGSTSGEIEYAKQLATQASQDATEALTQVADKVSKTDVVSTAEDLQTVVAEGKLADAVLMKKAYKDADDSITAIGTMTDLQTTEKTTLVGAINEAYNRQPDVLATKEEVEANTQAGMIADALVTKELSTEVAQLNQSLETIKTYSTEEQEIGTWINGKPLYRKVFNLGTNFAINEGATAFPNQNIFNGITPLNANFFVDGMPGCIPLVVYYASNNWFYTSNSIIVATEFRTVYLILEYTK